VFGAPVSLSLNEIGAPLVSCHPVGSRGVVSNAGAGASVHSVAPQI